MDRIGTASLTDWLPGMPTKVRDLTGGQEEYFALVWKACECFDFGANGEPKMNRPGFICPVHGSGEKDVCDHCYCGYKEGGKTTSCGIHKNTPLSIVEVNLLKTWVEVHLQAAESPVRDPLCRSCACKKSCHISGKWQCRETGCACPTFVKG